MKMLELINILQNGGECPAGSYNMLFRTGMLSTTVNFHIDIYQTFIRHFDDCKKSKDRTPKMTAVSMTSDDFNVSERTIFYVIKKIESS